MASQVLVIVLLIESNIALSFRVSGAQGCAKFLPPKLVKLLTKGLKTGAKMGKTVLQIVILSFSYSQFFLACDQYVDASTIVNADDDIYEAGDDVVGAQTAGQNAVAQAFADDGAVTEEEALVDDAVVEKVCKSYSFGVAHTDVCDDEAGGMDTGLSVLTLIAAVIAFPYMGHVLLNTFVWGTGASDAERDGFDWSDGLDAKEEESLVGAGYYHRPDQVVLEQLLAKSPPLAREIDDAAILLVRNPRFYLDVLGTSKKTFRAHLKTGELKESLKLYVRASLHKMRLLLQMTFGYWTKETLSVMEVKRFAIRFDVSGHEHKRAHQDIMEHFGCARGAVAAAHVFSCSRDASRALSPLVAARGTRFSGSSFLSRWFSPSLARRRTSRPFSCTMRTCTCTCLTCRSGCSTGC